MPKSPRPIKPRVKDTKEHEKSLEKIVLLPLFRVMKEGLAKVAAIEQVYNLIDSASNVPNMDRLVEEDVERFGREVGNYHKERLIASFNFALGVNINPVLNDSKVKSFLSQKIKENTDLIVTIPDRYRAGLTDNVTKLFFDKPFDRQALKEMLIIQHKSAGYNLRRIVRDQNNKIIGQLNQIRHTQLGIDRYRWGTSNDDRVRPTHRANANRIFYWKYPPEETGHPGNDIQCRCTAAPIIPENFRI